MESFTELNAWKESHQIVLQVYKLTKDYPKTETYGLTDQMRRAAVSITSNIAEGFGRQSYKEKIQFYFNSKGSLTELENQFIISRDLDYINLTQFSEIIDQLTTAKKLIQGLIQKTKSFIT